jgi:phospholipase C
VRRPPRAVAPRYVDGSMSHAPRLSRRQLLRAGVAGLGAAGLGALSDGRAYAATTPSGHAPSGARGLGPGGTLLPPDSRPFPHLRAGTDTMPQIEHVVVLMMENHSFDDHFGMLGRGDGLTLGADHRPVNYNPNPVGGYVRSFHNPNTVGYAETHISQSWDASHLSWDHGSNRGFVGACGPAAMGYWTEDDLPYYYSLAKKFPIGDRYFCSVMAQTYPNRRFLIAATALGDVTTSSAGVSSVDAPNGTIFDRLDACGISWKDYYPDLPTCALFLPNYLDNLSDGKVVHFEQFLTDAAAGTLPAFSIVDPYDNYSEEHNDISIGEAYAATIIDAVLHSPAWNKTALIYTYDEHGGWYDHVSPVPAVRPDNVPPEITVPPDQPGSYDYTGFRVPCVVVSPWAKRDHVSHVVYDHTSVLKFVETKWNLPAMTYRDANAHDLLDFFDFSARRAPFAEPPELAKPRNPFRGPLPANSQNASLFHPIATAVPGSGPAPGAEIARPPTHADALIARNTRRALATA